MGQKKSRTLGKWPSKNKVPDWMLSTQQGSIVNTAAFFVGSHVALRFVSPLPMQKANLKYTQMTLTLWKWAQFVVTEGTVLCVFECILPVLRGYCRKHFGVALNTSGPLLQLQYYCPPPPTSAFLFASGSLVWFTGHSVNFKEPHLTIRMRTCDFYLA